MKKYKYKSILLTSLVCSGLLVGCGKDFLEEDPTINEISITKYEFEEQLQDGVTGIYGQLVRAARWSTFYVNGWSGDDITTHKASNKADFREYDQRVISKANARTTNNWSGIYSMIRAANTVLANIEGVTLPNIDLQNQLIGETHFLRGTLLLHLTRVHGQIPLPLDVSQPDPQLALSSQQEVYEQIESDLLKAETLLPAITTTGAVKPNSGSARAMLSRLYLDWAGYQGGDATKYADAASSAKQVIDNKDTHGFNLMTNFEDLFKVANRFNEESIWTISYCEACGLDNRKYGKLGLPGDFAGWQETFAEIKFFEDFPEGPRKEATYLTEIPVDAAGKIDPTSTIMKKWTEFKDQQSPIFKKISGSLEDNTYGAFKTNRNDFYMRFAEVLLIYAEASGRSGNVTADAWEALNMVRRRAEGLPFDTPDASVDVTSGDIAELAFEERKWEFAGEFIRWNDLVRMQKVQEALSNRTPATSIGTAFDADGNGTPSPITSAANPILGSLGTENYFAPIPAGEIAIHPGLGGSTSNK